MQDFAKRRGNEIGRLAKSLGWMLVLLVVAVVLVRAAWGMYGKFTEAADSDAVAHEQLTVLEQQQAQVAASVASFSSSRGIEAQVRERYGLVKPGEGQIQIVEDTPTTTAQSAPAPGAVSRAWQALFGWL